MHVKAATRRRNITGTGSGGLCVGGSHVIYMLDTMLGTAVTMFLDLAHLGNVFDVQPQERLRNASSCGSRAVLMDGPSQKFCPIAAAGGFQISQSQKVESTARSRHL